MTWTRDFFLSNALVLLIALASAIGLTEIFDALLSSVLLVSELFAASITLDKFSTDVATDFVYPDPSMDELSLQNEGLSHEDSRVFLYFRIFPRYLSSRTALLRFLSETYMIAIVFQGWNITWNIVLSLSSLFSQAPGMELWRFRFYRTGDGATRLEIEKDCRAFLAIRRNLLIILNGTLHLRILCWTKEKINK